MNNAICLIFVQETVIDVQPNITLSDVQPTAADGRHKPRPFPEGETRALGLVRICLLIGFNMFSAMNVLGPQFSTEILMNIMRTVIYSVRIERLPG